MVGLLYLRYSIVRDAGGWRTFVTWTVGSLILRLGRSTGYSTIFSGVQGPCLRLEAGPLTVNGPFWRSRVHDGYDPILVVIFYSTRLEA